MHPVTKQARLFGRKLRDAPRGMHALEIAWDVLPLVNNVVPDFVRLVQGCILDDQNAAGTCVSDFRPSEFDTLAAFLIATPDWAWAAAA